MGFISIYTFNHPFENVGMGQPDFHFYVLAENGSTHYSELKNNVITFSNGVIFTRIKP